MEIQSIRNFDKKQTEASNVFLNFFKQVKLSSIDKIIKLENSQTNDCFLLKTHGRKKFFIRLGNPKINRSNEYNFIKISKNSSYLYFDKETGNTIKKWIKGRNPTNEECNSSRIFNNVCNQIKKLHKINPDFKSKFSRIDYYQFMAKAKISNTYKQKFDEILEKNKHLELVFSHNDISPRNIIINKSKVTLIDFEWGSLNNKYWDIANFMREIEFPISDIGKVTKKYFKYLNPLLLKDFLFATTCYGVQWSFNQQETSEILKYRLKNINLMDFYYSSFYS